MNEVGVTFGDGTAHCFVARRVPGKSTAKVKKEAGEPGRQSQDGATSEISARRCVASEKHSWVSNRLTLSRHYA